VSGGERRGVDMADLNHNGATAVALVSCSGLLGDLIRQTVASVPEVAVVEDLPFDDLRDLSAALHQAHPNVVVWLLDDETSIAEHTDLLWVERGCAVIAVLDDGRRSSVWELRPHRTAMDQPSMDGLIEALRNVAVRT
jgi:hypothetical protein